MRKKGNYTAMAFIAAAVLGTWLVLPLINRSPLDSSVPFQYQVSPRPVDLKLAEIESGAGTPGSPLGGEASAGSAAEAAASSLNMAPSLKEESSGGLVTAVGSEGSVAPSVAARSVAVSAPSYSSPAMPAASMSSGRPGSAGGGGGSVAGTPLAIYTKPAALLNDSSKFTAGSSMPAKGGVPRVEARGLVYGSAQKVQAQSIIPTVLPTTEAREQMATAFAGAGKKDSNAVVAATAERAESPSVFNFDDAKLTSKLPATTGLQTSAPAPAAKEDELGDVSKKDDKSGDKENILSMIIKAVISALFGGFGVSK
ncbi:MAG: hypothetical protein NTW04_02335 [Elusimicrobia bacterium]|nr:hypothetical protein [Elusimicrobiota bacterium]